MEHLRKRIAVDIFDLAAKVRFAKSCVSLVACSLAVNIFQERTDAEFWFRLTTGYLVDQPDTFGGIFALGSL